MHLALPKGVVLVAALLLVSLAGCGGGSPAQNSTSSATSTSSTTSAGVTPSGSAQPPTTSTSAQFTANPVSLDFGSVQVGNSATQSLVISNRGTADANINSLTTTNPAFRVIAPTVPFTLSAGYSITSQVQFVPSGAGTLAASLALAAPGAPTFNVPLAGTGVFAPAPPPAPTPGQHMATLTWGASSSVVNGYNVYRGGTSGGPYTRINAAPITALTFGDTTVTAGQTYYYVVTAISSGTESAYSNQVQAVIPSP